MLDRVGQLAERQRALDEQTAAELEHQQVRNDLALRVADEASTSMDTGGAAGSAAEKRACTQ